ncbi:cytochrome P450 [Stakelama tenebrarum]|uniref:Cytochrome P450 n=1 Tax=Stakelama tenebrarum TaxID=2711215 RepID=A0A6G6Y4K0_9SPHN|nr:cytochrome P450 [Sphingosinithalassobacter tenebrarum]QIG79648.1 cytochrome P450 [Sphingosinithalassobacter tenebrarum]
MSTAPETQACPIAANRDDRKSAPLADRFARPDAGAQRIGNLAFARDILRSPVARQAGAGAEFVDTGNPEHAPVFYLDGAPHRKKRAAIARFFTPKAVTTRHRAVMERTTEALIGELRANGRAQLDEISFRLAVAVAAEIVGLADGDLKKLSRRIEASLSAATANRKRGLAGAIAGIGTASKTAVFYWTEVRPAIRARRKERRDDVISHLIDEGYSDRAILIECMTYGAAGMVTTREFIVMVAWHLFERPDLVERYLASDDDGQIAILQEILRLEPVAAMVHRRATEAIETPNGELEAGALVALDIRASNTDAASVGACPFAIDPDRAERVKGNGNFLSFGDGGHTCPGWQVALHETRIFIDALMRVPGLKLERAPDMTWNSALMSYELRNAIVVC